MNLPSSERKYRYAGISVTLQNDGTKTLKFHVSKLKSVIAVWLEVPGSAFYEYVQLPHLMNKHEAACYLARQKNFQSPAVMRDFIQNLCDKYDPNQKVRITEPDEQTIPKKKRRRKKESPPEQEY